MKKRLEERQSENSHLGGGWRTVPGLCRPGEENERERDSQLGMWRDLSLTATGDPPSYDKNLLGPVFSISVHFYLPVCLRWGQRVSITPGDYHCPFPELRPAPASKPDTLQPFSKL